MARGVFFRIFFLAFHRLENSKKKQRMVFVQTTPSYWLTSILDFTEKNNSKTFVIIDNLGCFEFKHQTHKSNFFPRVSNEKKRSNDHGHGNKKKQSCFVCCFSLYLCCLFRFWLLLERLFWSRILVNLLVKRSVVCEERRLIYLRVDIAIRHNHIFFGCNRYIWDLLYSSLALLFLFSFVTTSSHEFIKLFCSVFFLSFHSFDFKWFKNFSVWWDIWNSIKMENNIRNFSFLFVWFNCFIWRVCCKISILS